MLWCSVLWVSCGISNYTGISNIARDIHLCLRLHFLLLLLLQFWVFAYGAGMGGGIMSTVLAEHVGRALVQHLADGSP